MGDGFGAVAEVGQLLAGEQSGPEYKIFLY